MEQVFRQAERRNRQMDSACQIFRRELEEVLSSRIVTRTAKNKVRYRDDAPAGRAVQVKAQKVQGKVRQAYKPEEMDRTLTPLQLADWIREKVYRLEWDDKNNNE